MGVLCAIELNVDEAMLEGSLGIDPLEHLRLFFVKRGLYKTKDNTIKSQSWLEMQVPLKHVLGGYVQSMHVAAISTNIAPARLGGLKTTTFVSDRDLLH